MKYHAEIRKEIILEFDFDEDEIEDGSDEFEAAMELSHSYSDWDEAYFDVDVVKVP